MILGYLKVISQVFRWKMYEVVGPHSGLFLLAIVSILIVQRTVTAEGKCPPDPEEVENLFKQFKDIQSDRNALEKKLVDEGKIVQRTEKIADLSHNRMGLTVKDRDVERRNAELKQIIFEAVTDKLVEKYHLTQDQVRDCLPKVPLNGEYSSKARAECETTLFSGHCNASSKYRTTDGTCNNLQNPMWGAFGNKLERTLPARYEGVAGYRQSVKGGPLPEPRKLSLNIHAHLDVPTHDITHMFMFFGQITDHDITQAPFSITLDNLAIKCCVDGEVHPQCKPFPIDPEDPFYKQFGTTCMNFVRSASYNTCKLGPRQQINQIAAFIDGSVMYGLSDKQCSGLRTNDGTGKMKIAKTSAGDLLPPSPYPNTDQCSFPETNDLCFQAGDPRANEHPPLTSLQTIYVREHNRLADGLKKLNPSWDGENLFQEARRIFGAILQNLVYGEFLPIVIGEEQLDRYKLRVSKKRRTEYDPNTDPSIKNEFNAAGFRFGHTLINSVLYNHPLNSTGGKAMLRDLFFQPFGLRQGILSEVMKGCTRSPAQTFDRHLVPDVTDFLYRIRGEASGMDLASVNIHRGRDQGLPPYAEMARHCSRGNLKLKTFNSFVRNGYLSKANAQLLKQNYKSVEDIDLWTGMLSERPLKGAIVGPTGACIIGTQFHDLKFGDRFFFEHRNQVGSFTYPQLQEIKKMTLSKLICLNTDVKELQKNSLLYPSKKNPMMQCSDVQGVNLALWKEKS